MGGLGSSGITVIDLFCGAGGFSEGFHQAGFDVVCSIDLWEPACKTHQLNSLGRTVRKDLLTCKPDDVLRFKKALVDEHGEIDVVIGSPPCTEFSYAKNGGRGDIDIGMLLVRQHLLFVALFQPKYWLMENVPRLKDVLDEECQKVGAGWEISYEKLGITEGLAGELGLIGSALSIPCGRVYLASDYGTCERRKRFIAGNFPISEMESMANKRHDLTLGSLIDRLELAASSSKITGQIEDPNYPGRYVAAGNLRDYFYDTTVHPMYLEEMRHKKRRHIQYGRMELADDLRKPARTIMATYQTSSREAFLVDTGKSQEYQGRARKVYRQLKLRELACIQGFPLNFQLDADTLSERYRLIGNAVPCQLSYALATSIRKDAAISKDRSSDVRFKDRVATSIRRAEEEGGPILSQPTHYIGEALDLGTKGVGFSAKSNKHFRRKLLSSKLEIDSCMVVFENSELINGRVSGSDTWKACIQRGIGSEYHRTYLDDTSIGCIIRAIDSCFDPGNIKDLLRQVLEEIDFGVPRLRDDWVEFPGYKNGIHAYRQRIGEGRLSLPSMSDFQKLFTSDGYESLDGIVGPIDLFDGLDAIMLTAITDGRHLGLKDDRILITHLADSDIYPNRNDKRIIPYIDGASIPIVTIASAILSVHALRRMYDSNSLPNHHPYVESISLADDNIMKWLGDGA